MSRRLYKIDTPQRLQAISLKKILNVAAYARVSSKELDQKTSLEAQKDYYEKKINANPEWNLFAVYSDDGITGTSYTKREGFQQMLADCEAGSIDMIITKSISRFARNTVDTITVIRRLRELGIGVLFEKENVWSMDSKGEFVLTLLASMAQEEARGISENTAWGKRKRMADGRYSVIYSRFMGYDKGFVINEEQARTVRYIFKRILTGLSPFQIAKELTEAGVPTASKQTKWWSNSVHSILRNEKYKGDALLQKYYIDSFLTKKELKNHGELTQYYVEGGHEPIIEPALFDYVQGIMIRKPNQQSGHELLSSKIVCGKCGATYGPKYMNSNNKYRHIIWQCRNRFRKDNPCYNRFIHERDIDSFWTMSMLQLLDRHSEVKTVCKSVLAEILDSEVLITASHRIDNFEDKVSLIEPEECAIVIKKVVILDEMQTVVDDG